MVPGLTQLLAVALTTVGIAVVLASLEPLLLGLIVLATQWWLRRRGLPAAVELARRELDSPVAEELGAHAYEVRLGGLVTRTLRPLPADTRCLARALVLTRLLARRKAVRRPGDRRGPSSGVQRAPVGRA